MARLQGLTRRVNALAYDRATHGELAHLEEESREPGAAASAALVELALPVLEDVEWNYTPGSSGHAETIGASLDEFDEIGSGDDDATEDGSSSVDDYYDPDDDEMADGEGEADPDYGTGGATDPSLVGEGGDGEGDGAPEGDAADWAGDPDDTSEEDAELAELGEGLDELEEDEDDGTGDALDEGARPRLRPGEVAVF